MILQVVEHDLEALDSCSGFGVPLDRDRPAVKSVSKHALEVGRVARKRQQGELRVNVCPDDEKVLLARREVARRTSQEHDKANRDRARHPPLRKPFAARIHLQKKAKKCVAKSCFFISPPLLQKQKIKKKQ